jgi:hypothetical protein
MATEDSLHTPVEELGTDVLYVVHATATWHNIRRTVGRGVFCSVHAEEL